MKPKTSDNPTPRNLESGSSDDDAGTIGVHHVDLQFGKGSEMHPQFASAA